MERIDWQYKDIYESELKNDKNGAESKNIAPKIEKPRLSVWWTKNRIIIRWE